MLSEERIKELEILQERLNYRFKELNLLNEALTHKSYVNEKNSDLRDNERLEFLGDSVIDLIVGDYSFKRFSNYSEGDLSKIRAAVVNEIDLAEIARRIGIGRFILLGKGEEQSGGESKNSILSNTFEAIIAAIYLESGLENTYSVIINIFKERIDDVGNSCHYRDFKSELQEFTQGRFNCIPSYRISSESGPDHEKVFEINVIIGGVIYGKGKGKNKKEAEQLSAKEALDKLLQDPSSNL
ncbi:MAG: ribonuclease III [Nitrospinae bacterium]|nr:ribonuclease III [Nitrospinota bacterium]